MSGTVSASGGSSQLRTLSLRPGRQIVSAAGIAATAPELLPIGLTNSEGFLSAFSNILILYTTPQKPRLGGSDF